MRVRCATLRCQRSALKSFWPTTMADAFALDISGPWTANVPRERGEMVLFNINIDGGDLSALTGVGSQLYGGQSWDFKIVSGSLEQDKITIKLEFGPNDTEEWVGELVGGVEMKMSYSRRTWTSQVFVLKKGVGVAPPPSPQRSVGGGGTVSNSPARAAPPQPQAAKGASGDSVASSLCVIS